jgi:glycosyltransferase involved in cell wall biosynthesis
VIAKQILINSRLYGRGGRETHIKHLCELLVSQGAHVTVVSRFIGSSTLSKELMKIPVRVVTTPFSKSLSLFRFATAWAMLIWPLQMKRGSFDVIYSLEASRFLVWLRRFQKQIGMTIWNPVGEVSQFSQFEFDYEIDRIVVETEWHRGQMAKLSPIPIFTAPHLSIGVPFRRLERHRNCELIVGFLGRLDSAKGIFRLLEVWPNLEIQPARLTYFGDGSGKGLLRDQICQRKLQNQVDVNVCSWSSEEELRSIMESIDLLILPSESEGLPLVLIEALGYGVPFVAFDVGAIHTLAVNNPGISVVPTSSHELKAGIEEMCRKLRSNEIDHQSLRMIYEKSFSSDALEATWTNIFCK